MDEFLSRLQKVLDDGAEQIRQALVPSADSDAITAERDQVISDIYTELQDFHQTVTDQGDDA